MIWVNAGGQTIIRCPSSADHTEIRALLEDAFATSTEADLVEALRSAGAMACELVDASEEGVSGYCALSAMQSPPGTSGLGPVAVMPAARGSGRGSALISAGLDRVRATVSHAVFVLGEPDFYRRFGFSTEAAQGFDHPYPKEFMMALELVPNALSRLAGPLRYAKPFEDLG